MRDITGFKLHLASSMLFVLAAMTAARAASSSTLPWLTFKAEPSPVARLLDPLLLNPNGFITSDGWTQRMELRQDGDGDGVAWWTVTPKKPSPSPSLRREGGKRQWAALRFGLPDNLPVPTAGVVLHLTLTQPETVNLLAYTGGDNFYRAKRVGKRITRKLEPGAATVELHWSEMGVKKPEAITGVGLDRHSLGAMGIDAVDLIFADQAAADRVAKWRRARHHQTMQVMLGWIAARGIDLRGKSRLAGDAQRPMSSEKGAAARRPLNGDALESRGWTAVWLLGMGEQIDAWSKLISKLQVADGSLPQPLPEGGGQGHSLSGGGGLEGQRQALVDQLKQGREVKQDVAALQAKVDSWIDECMKRIPVDQQRWSVGADHRFHRPDGRPYRMLGPHFFRAMYTPRSPSKLWRPWDVRYLAGLGFNGMRLHIRWNELEPTRGHFNQAYLDMLLNIMREAQRYGVGVSVDLHWPYPDWFIAGDPKYKPDEDYVKRTPPAHNPYQWPDALVDSWGRLAAAFKDVPNIVAFEVPTNEPNFGNGPRGLKDYPEVMHLWNQWLKKRYGSLDKLNAVWSAAANHADRYALHSSETWDKDSIEPLGYQQGDHVNVAAAYAENPRLWDHLQFGAWLQETTTGRIMRAIRKSIPDAVGMMQRTIGTPFDKSPVPLDYHAISTLRGAYVMPGTHYGMGGLGAREAASITLASYDSEQDMENKEAAFKRHIKLGLGVCPFSFHARGGGGMLFSDDAWHLKKSVAYLPRLSHWARTYWPEGGVEALNPSPPSPSPSLRREGGKVAIVENTRLGATTGLLVGDLPDMLQMRGVDVGVFEGLEVVSHPELLDGYDLAITPAAYMDTQLLEVLNRKFKGRVLLFGRLDRDAYARKAKAGLPAALARDGLFLRSADLSAISSAQTGRIDLAGTWQWRFTGRTDEHPDKLPGDHERWKWSTMPVPGYWGETGMTGSKKYHMGDAWYRKEIVIPESWRGRSLELKIGAIDDGDWTFFNGKLIGSIPPGHRNSYRAPRQYSIPQSAIHWGKPNVLMIRVRNTFMDGGIWKGPVTIVSQQSAQVHWSASALGGHDHRGAAPIRLGQHPTWFGKGDLLPAVRVLARAQAIDHATAPAMIEQGRWFWWIGAGPWTSNSAAQAAVLDGVLRR